MQRREASGSPCIPTTPPHSSRGLSDSERIAMVMVRLIIAAFDGETLKERERERKGGSFEEEEKKGVPRRVFDGNR